MESEVTVKYQSSLQVIPPSVPSGATPRPDAYELSFSAKHRIGYQVRSIVAAGSLTITLADEGLATSDFFKLEVLSAGKTVSVAFDGSVTPFTLGVTDSTKKAVLEGTINFNSVVVTNLDANAAIDVGFGIFSKKV